MGIFEDGRLVGLRRAGRPRTWKCWWSRPNTAAAGWIGEIVGELMRRGCEAGCGGFFIFTRPCTAPTFARLGFKPLVER